MELLLDFTPQCLKAVRVLFSPMMSRWMGGLVGKSLSRLYLRNCKVEKIDTLQGHWLGGVP